MAPKKFKPQGAHAAQDVVEAAPSQIVGKPASFLQLALPLSTSALSATPATASVSPLVMVSILDHYLRRRESQPQILGILLGVRTTDSFGMNQVQALNAFALKYSETSDHKTVIDTEYFTKMNALHQQVNSKEVVVGWYTTGSELNNNSVWIQNLFAGETTPVSPLVLLVDPLALAAGAETFPAQAFVSSPAGVAGSDKLGSLFVRLPVSYQTADKSGMDTLIRATESVDLEASLTSDLDGLELSVRSVHDMLATVGAYVESVVSGETKPNAALGRYLLDTVSSTPRVDPNEFSKVFNGHMQDLLMVVYLANLTRTQLAIAERLHKMV
ncbi:hypothetical protein BASA50_007620 [Batrachochytrium salamandrivorans]|uniref:MPN domain-containing protein n=1 Tax=Batrachochytrium salamandrivorans TaxID=1357716 RepID=A0ABQ8F731_9FUNG|nr:hypothetical protein BASA60_007601 [Batrachochytrium salamandrivorans]KAH6578127.1 hypothetical protein BASA62_000419 [Batrachochytrium salamandrivorans]KAH6582430.1 hypothetical protein BASA61_008539 [Batrachochytrium salamandrivorans]KAH6593100.1 hypothetical protein BASA50_007620 [Batrachochytrium salamandrivorans]KAH9266473.1 hypothetical protein BASA84_001109 [Batrachochytrium salamandrivorans]